VAGDTSPYLPVEAGFMSLTKQISEFKRRKSNFPFFAGLTHCHFGWLPLCPTLTWNRERTRIQNWFLASNVCFNLF